MGAESEVPVPDLTAFVRERWSFLDAVQLVTLISVVQGEIGYSTRPQDVPIDVLEAMGWDPIVYLGERAILAPILDPEIYYVRHRDPAIVAETEAWLSPILHDLLKASSRAIPYGRSPYVLDWEVGDLEVTVRREGGEEAATLPGHVHFGRVHEIYPGDAELRVQADDLVGIGYQGVEYGADRSFCSVSDRAWGRWLGAATRRRAYRAWFRQNMVELWRDRYLERSVDPPRIGFAPKGEIEIDGQKVASTKMLAAALLALKNGGAAGLPSEFDRETKQRVWGVEVLQLPDRSTVWTSVLSRFDYQKLMACLVPPSAVGAEDSTFAGAKIPERFMKDTIESHAAFLAREASKVVAKVHRVAHGAKGTAPVVCARELPDSKRKLLLEVLKLVSNVERVTKGGLHYTLGELVGEELIDDLGLPKRPVAEAAREPRGNGPGPTGRPIDNTGGRDQRREDAITIEGEDATGSPSDSPDAELASLAAPPDAPPQEAPPQQIIVNIEAAAPIVVPAPQVTIEAASPVVIPPAAVTIEAASPIVIPAPILNIEAAAPIVVPAPQVNIEAAPPVVIPAPNVMAAAPVILPAPVVNLTVEAPASTPTTIEIKRDSAGRIKSAEIVDGGGA